MFARAKLQQKKQLGKLCRKKIFSYLCRSNVATGKIAAFSNCFLSVKNMKKSIIPIIAILLFISCGKEPPVPKPNTYLRLSVPQPKFLHYEDKSLPFTFDYPDYGEIVPLKSDDKSSIWFNIIFERYGFEANVSYVPIKSDTSLAYMVNDCYTFLDRHKKLSSGIVERQYENKEARVYGTAFEIKGSEVVSPYQFYLTDSLQHFVRVALHCRFAPNNDSLAAVIDRIDTDLNHLISSLRWK